MQHLSCGLVELKFAQSETDQMIFSGYGAVFGNIDSYGDMIEPGAFAAYLSDVKNGKAQWPAMLLQHGGWGMTAEDITPIGVWTDLAEDGAGLKVTGKLADTPRGREIYSLMKMEPRPAINGLSIGYIAKDWEPRSKPEDPRRKLKRIELVEISPVTFPANGKARVDSVKSIDELNSLSDIETYLREVGGFSRGEAKALVARIKAAGQREAGGDLNQLAAALKRNINSLKGVET